MRKRITTSARFFLDTFSCSSCMFCSLPPAATSGWLGGFAGEAAGTETEEVEEEDAAMVALLVLALLLLLLLLFREALLAADEDDFFIAAKVAASDDVEDDDEEADPFLAAVDIAALSFCRVA